MRNIIYSTCASVGLMSGCSEVAKLIPAAPSPESPGFETRDFSSTNDGQSLAGDPLLGLQPALQASRESFQKLGENRLADEMNGMTELSNTLLAALRNGQTQASLQNIPAPPLASSPELQASLREWEKTKVRTNVLTALTSDESAPLTFRTVWPLASEDGPKKAMTLLRAANSVYRGLARDFDPRRQSAAEAGILPAKLTEVSELTLHKTKFRTVYVRSMQPLNEFQAAVQCAQATYATTEGLSVQAIWPRILLKESPGHPEQQTKGKTEMRGVFRLNLTYDDPDESGRSHTISARSISHDLHLVRTSSSVSIRIQTFLSDGAQSGQSYALFHEARELFLFRFAASRRTTREISHLWTSYRIPFARVIIGVTEQRSDLGLSRRFFADSQSAYLSDPNLFNAAAGFPSDKWLRLDQLNAYNDQQEPVPPSSLSASDEYGIHVLSPQTISIPANFSYFFKNVENTLPGTEDAERHVLDKDDYDAMINFCKSLF